MDLSLYLILFSIAGARLFYVALHWKEFSGDPLSIVNPFQNPGEFGVAGLVFYGGFLFGVLTAILYAVRKGISFLALADLMAPSIALGLTITRIGCFLNGCCFGTPCDLAWAVRFPADSPAGGLFQVPVHPSQIYESLGAFVVFCALLIVDRHRPYSGFTFWTFLGFYGVLRFLVDLSRYYDPGSSLRLMGHAFSVNQVISVCLVLTALAAFAWPRKSPPSRRPMARPLTTPPPG
jgi:phosphatidylglycerol:prolipoprotein diacylglycerol transferase